MKGVRGIHHVSAISSDPRRTLRLYRDVLGLTLVKRSVNFDDPRTYHLYFGDATGSPGSIMTFFLWPHGQPGRVGSGQVAVTSFAIPADALGHWIQHLLAQQVPYEGPTRRASEQVLTFRDPDGLMLELVATPALTGGTAIQRFHSVTLWVEDHDATHQVLTGPLGLAMESEDGTTRRYGPVDVRAISEFGRGSEGTGTVHHVAFTVDDDAHEMAVREQVIGAGLAPTPMIDRHYFHSVYFREPGGVLFELATAGPGFLVDEPAEALGTRLMLPPRLEPDRAAIERALPSLDDDGSMTLDFVHQYQPGEPTLLLLHGTGGDEHDLVPLAGLLHADAGVLSPRGKVLEHGAPRFFRRLREGVFDLDDLAARTDELAAFVHAASGHYGFDGSRVMAAGFSNGANIAVSLLLRHPGLLHAAILLSPMLPYEPDPVPDLSGTRVFIGAGRMDPIAPPDQVERLADVLRRAGAEVTLHWEPGGHQLTKGEVDAAAAWIAERL